MLRLFKKTKHVKIYDDYLKLQGLQEKDKISFSQSFQKYIEEVLPLYETKIETSILKTLYNNLKDPLLKKHLINVYKRRQLHLIYKAFKPDMSVLPIQPAEPPPPTKISYLGSDIARVRAEDVGKIYHYPLEEFLQYFPQVNYGHLDFVDRVMKRTKAFAFQMSKEAFSTIEILRKQQYLKTQSFDSFRMKHLFRNAKTQHDLEELLSDHEIFLKLVFTIGDDFREILNPLRFEPNFKPLFGNSFLTDYIGMILVWNLHRPEIRNLILDSEKRPVVLKRIIEEIMTHPNSKYFLPHKIESWFENQLIMTLSDDAKIDLLKLDGCHKKVPQKLRHFMFPNFVGWNSNALFWGQVGAGKSGLLYAVTMWAIKSNWLVLKMASAKALTWSQIESLERHERSRLWMAPVMAKAVLQDFYNTNKAIFEQTPVDLSLYGCYDIVGVHKSEQEPVPNFYIEERKTHFYDSEQFMHEEHRIAKIREQEHLEVPLGKKLPKPANLAEIAEYGLNNPEWCTNCIAEILEQAYNQTLHPLLVAIDDFNWFFRPTNNPAYYYQNIKTLEGFVPPYHVALARLFMKFDGHLIRNGFKVAGTSNYSITRHHFTPKKIHFPEEFCQELSPMRFRDTENFVTHFAENNAAGSTPRDLAFYGSLWMESQGNYGRMVRLILMPEVRGLDG